VRCSLPKTAPRSLISQSRARAVRPFVRLLALGLLVLGRPGPSAAGPRPAGARPAWVGVPDGPARAVLRAANVGDLEQRDGHAMLIEADPAALARLRAAGLSVWEAAPPPPAGRDPAALDAALAALADAHPGLARLVTLGESVEGRPILGLVIGEGAGPRTRLLGAHHGDEAISADLCLAVAAALLVRATNDEAVAARLTVGEVWIVPQVNPDGIAAGTRHNANGVDLNRNYGAQWRDSEWASGAGPYSEPEVAAVRLWSSTRAFGAGLSAHAGALNLGWVLNWTTAPVPEAPTLEEIAVDYAAQVDDPTFWITNGADWYVTYGDTTDWAYTRQGTFDYTLEISADKAPPAAEAAARVEAQVDAALDFLLQPMVGARLVDARSGRPIPGQLTAGAGAPFAAGPDGGASRPARATRSVRSAQASAPGYDPLDVILDEDLPLTVALEPGPRGEGRAVLWPDGQVEGALGGRVRLHRFGEAVVEVNLDDPAALVAAALLPGPWDVEQPGGRVHPRGLLVAPAGRIALPMQVALDENGVLLDIGGELPPREAYLFSGADRAWVPVQLRAEAGGYRLTAAQIDDPDADLLVIAGDRLGLVAAVGRAPAVLGGPATTLEANRGGRFSVYGCAAAPGLLPWGALVSLALLTLRRSHPCPTSLSRAPRRR
jgi:hypothetical protein